MQYTNGTNIKIRFTEEVLTVFEQHKQIKEKSLEAGGQLFARLSSEEILVSRATGLREGDKRGRFLFWPNRKKEQDEIEAFHEEGYHYVGDWHTHPEPCPTPSNTDLINILECYNQSNHDLKYFIMVIVGTKNFPDGLHVSACNACGSINLSYEM